MLNKIFAQVKKDFLILASYKLAFLSNFLGVLASILTYFFIDKLFGHRLSGHLTEFGVNYFSYVLLSMAFFGYIGVGVGSFSLHPPLITEALERRSYLDFYMK